MNFLLAIDPNKSLKPLEALSFGAQTLLLGMVTVFAVLIIIWLCIVLLKVLIHDLPEKRKKQMSEAPAAPTAVQESVHETNDDEIVAVIAAAIAQAETENSGLKFRVVSFRRK